MKRHAARVLLVLSLMLAPSLFPAFSTAGTYDVRACIYEAPLLFDARYEQYGAGRVDVVHNCNTQPRGWFGIYQTRKGTPFAYGEGAGFRWYAPGGSSFVASRVLGKLRNANGIAAQFYATNPEGGYYSLDANAPHDGVERVMYVDFSGSPRSQVAARLACLTSPPCSNRATDVKAFFELRHITLTLRDSTPPTVSATGDLFNRPPGQDIYRGAVNFSYVASDSGGGIQQAYAEVNSTVVDLGAYYCVGAHNGFADRTQPCPANEGRHGTFDTSRPPFGEGHNQVRICVRDYATAGTANVGCTPARHFTVDNTPPAAPIGLTVEGGQGWRAENGFNLSWTNPPGQTTPLVAAHYRLEDATTGAVVQGQRQVQGVDISALHEIMLPRSGHFRIRIWLQDAAGNTGPAASVSLRLDDQAPGGISPLKAPAWLSARDFPFRPLITQTQGSGPSGIAGIAVTVNPDQPLTPCPAGRCTPDEVTVLEDVEAGQALEIGHLDQGVHWLSLAPVSAAMLRSEQIETVRLQVDSEDPRTTLKGVPEGWARGPVTLKVEAHDTLSGMQPSSDQPGDPPVSVLEIEGQPSVQRVGAAVAAEIDREGVHRVKYWARDLAGNANDGSRQPNGHLHDPPGEAVVRIDRTPPTVGFLEQDPQQPELVRAQVVDRLSGPAGGEISYRRAGTLQPFIPLETRSVGDRLEAHLPSDYLPAGGYEFQAIALDRAGNVGQGGTRLGGDAMVLELPLKAPVAIIAGFPKKKGSRQLLRHGASAAIKGRITDGEGRPLGATRIELVERFDRGARTDEKVSDAFTDETGGFRFKLEAGPSRRVSVRYPGSRLLARTESSPLRIVSRARISFSISPQVIRNRDTVSMRGRVRGRGAFLPSGGKLVAIQYLDPGRRRWRPAELVRTDRRGKFRHRYRFRTVASPQRFIFRAVVPAEAGWPYRPAHSGRKNVVVYPR